MSGRMEQCKQEQGGGSDIRSINSPLPPGSGAAEKEEEEEVILVSFLIPLGPISHVLYAIRLPPTKGGGDVGSNNTDAPLPPPPLGRPEEENKTIYPILEIPSEQCAPSMCCAKLRSRLYYLGGKSDEFDNCTREVNYIDIDQEEAIVPSSPPPEQQQQLLLKQGVPMKHKKKSCYAFVFDDKMYAIGPHAFEVFDPDSGEWSTLPGPPLNFLVTSHAVVDGGNKIVFTSAYPPRPRFHYYDLKISEWGRLYPHIKPASAHQWYGPALHVGDRLYYPFDYNETIVSSGPTHPTRLSKLFETPCFASGELSQLLAMGLDYSSWLMYLGNNKFLSVMGIKLPHPEYPDSRTCARRDKGALRVVVFEVTGEKDFQTKVLHTYQYIHTSKTGVEFYGSQVSGCFSLKRRV